MEREKIQILLESNRKLTLELEQKRDLLLSYESQGSAADGSCLLNPLNQFSEKIRALNIIHADKIRALMNSIQILKKENKNLEKLTKEANRSQLIEQLQKDISDLDTVVAVIRSFVPDEKADAAIIEALNKGPERIKAPTREEQKIEIKRLKSQVILLK